VNEKMSSNNSLVTTEQVKDIFKELNSNLRKNNIHINFVDMSDDGIVKIKPTGICKKCYMSKLITQYFMYRILKKRLPAITNVVAV
jgi:Fe-S cluster biogenesis protein NfuA